MITESAVANCWRADQVPPLQISRRGILNSRDRVRAWHFFLFFLRVFVRAPHLFFFNTPFQSSFYHKIFKMCFTCIGVVMPPNQFHPAFMAAFLQWMVTGLLWSAFTHLGSLVSSRACSFHASAVLCCLYP